MTQDAETETAALVIEDLLDLLPPEKRAAALAKAVAVENARGERRKTDPLEMEFLDDGFSERFMKSPSFRYWNRVMRLKARLIYVFTRNITNNHSPEDAARLLFERHHNVAGSGWLSEYLRQPAST